MYNVTGMRLIFLSKNEKKFDQIKTICLDFGFVASLCKNYNEIFKHIIENVKFVIVDCDFLKNENVIFLKKLKVSCDAKNVLLVLLANENCENSEILQQANCIVQYPIVPKIFQSAINSALKMKSSLEVLSKSNSELAGSLYLLDVLYNTSSKLAGTLDKNKLINVMLEGLEKSLSFQLSYTLIYNGKDDFSLIINSLHPLSERFEQAIKLRALLSYNNLFNKKEELQELNSKSIKTIKHIKHPFNEYDLNLFKSDNLFSPISLGENFFGLIEVFRNEDFTQEDATCFQTLTKQVSLPLESAILYERIKNANSRLEQLERLKSDFISIVSHELRTPLTAIKNSLDIVLKGKTGEIADPTEKFLQMAKRNVQRLSGIINDLLDLSKVEEGKMEFHFEKSCINSPIEFVKNTFENLAKEKEISIETKLMPNEKSKLYIDPQRIEQVLTNLVSNSIKFTGENGKIKISTQIIRNEEIPTEFLYDQNFDHLNDYQHYFKVSVEDNGIGIEKENLKGVFDKFRQVENSLNRKIGGTGLGLPIAKHVVNAHFGFIWVESEPKVKTKFSFCIPVMNEKQIFNIEAKKQVQNAKINENNLCVLQILEPQGANFSPISEILNEKVSLIRKTDKNLYFSFEENGQKFLFVFVPSADKFASDFILKKLETYLHSCLNKKMIEKEICDKILFSTVVYPLDAKNWETLQEKSNKNLKHL